MNIKDILTGVITGAILALGATFFIFQERVTKLEAKSTISEESVHKKTKEAPTVNLQMHKESSDIVNVRLSLTTGTTNLTSERCGIQARKAFQRVNFSNIDMTISLQDSQKNYSPSEKSPRSVKATNNGNKYLIFCKPFSTEIVIFSYAGTGKNKTKAVWDAFYK